MNKKVEKFEDRVANLCLHHFYSLPKTGKPTDREWTVLSCVVLENANKFEVVALGTGSKCVGHDKLSKNGDIVNDSHGEVICRRAFMRYLYEEIFLSENSDNKLLVYDKSEEKFRLKDSVKFHFFTTHVPCGDAAIFQRESTENHGLLIEEPESKRIKLDEEAKTDIFRTGAKCLEDDSRQDLKLDGAEYHVTGVVRTKPGRGINSLSVSCSDKLAKWCHLGVQGALLSVVLDKPIFFESFVIIGETPFNQEALERALYSRLGDDITLTPPYKRHKPIIKQSQLSFKYSKSDEKHPCPSSIIWIKTDSKRQIEIAVDGRRQGVTKKQMQTAAGRLKICKKEFFINFKKVVEQFNITVLKDYVDELTYKQAKNKAELYQESWKTLKHVFKVWTKKKDDLLRFRCVD